MMADALLAYFHFSAIFALFAFLSVEAVILRYPVDGAGARMLARVDLFYFAAAILALVSGLLRVFMGAKGADFYMGNPVFHAKVGLFVLIGALSVSPTLQFMRWRRALAASPSFTPPDDERRRARRMVMIEIHLAALLPLFAVLMSRGIGFK